VKDEYDWSKHQGFRHKEINIGLNNENMFYIWEDEISGMLNDRDNIKAINMYIRSKKWGLPFGGGWADQPAWIMDVFDWLEDAEVRYGKRTTVH